MIPHLFHSPIPLRYPTILHFPSLLFSLLHTHIYLSVYFLSFYPSILFCSPISPPQSATHKSLSSPSPLSLLSFYSIINPHSSLFLSSSYSFISFFYPLPLIHTVSFYSFPSILLPYPSTLMLNPHSMSRLFFTLLHYPSITSH